MASPCSKNNLIISILATVVVVIVSANDESNNYIVHMDLSAMPKAFANHHSWYFATLSSISQNAPQKSTSDAEELPPSLIYAYTHAIHGFSAKLSLSELEALKGSPGYLYSTRDSRVTVDTTHSMTFLGLSSGGGSGGAWASSDYGKGVIIGLVDTGVWPESASFNDDGMPEVPSRWRGQCESGTKWGPELCNRKLIGARFFNKGLIAHLPRNMTLPMNSTRDSDGHGTHTSTTAAGSRVDGASYFGYAPGTAGGVAPGAHVAMYKALWDEGGFTSDLIAAIDAAVGDGVDVLSLSFGIDGVPLYQDPVGVATFSAMDKGIFVSTSAGNEGPFYASLHNGIPWVLTVAAGTIDREFNGVLNLGNGVSIPGSALFQETDSVKTRVPIVFMGSCRDAKKLNKVGKKIVVCQDKNNTVSEQVGKVEDAKVYGGVFITDNDDLEFLIQSSFPAIFITGINGAAVRQYVKSANAVASMEFGKTVLGSKSAPKATTYTSRGPSPSVPAVLKPDVMAPGSLILASWPSNVSVGELNGQRLYSRFNLLSGTSMACPHAAGVAALLRAARPEWTPAVIRSAMMTTSDVTDRAGGPIKDIGRGDAPANPLAIGSGHINPNKALNPGLVYDVEPEDYVSILCALNYTKKQIKVITKSSPPDCSKYSHLSYDDLNYPSFISFFNANDTRTVREFKRTVTNIDDGWSTYVAKLTPMEGLDVKVFPDRLSFRDKGEKKNFTLRIEGPSTMKSLVVFGHLTWVKNDKSQLTVRSPIVATNLDSSPIL